MICGIDEAGRGPLAGAVYAAAVVLGERGKKISGIDDSKKIKESQRDALAIEIRSEALAWAVVAVDAHVIDQINILQATLKAMNEAFLQLASRDRVSDIIIDGTQLPKALLAWSRENKVKLTALPKADATVMEVGAASILAKTARDKYMIEMDAKFPQYGFAQHKGYGTPQHLAAIERFGPCELHRKSFAPISQYKPL
jgi:ribonuclease HII